MPSQTNAIKKQVRLPLSVAMEVVMRGIRIRLGRSVVTISGVLLGVAFLMSVLAGQLIRAGVSQEQQLRNKVGRMVSFLEAETGPVAGRRFAVVQNGALSLAESRLIRRIADQGGEVRYHRTQGRAPEGLGSLVQPVELGAIGKGVSALVVVGDAADQLDLAWAKVMAEARQPVVASAHKDAGKALPAGMRFARLSRELRPAEIAARQAEQQRQWYRSVWILTIALIVTVIGIANAMIMSVTERFREIGTMKCLGALSSFVRRLFLIESSLMGLVGGIVGAIGGALFSMIAYALTYGFGLIFTSVNYPYMLLAMLVSVVGGVVLSVLAAIYPANFAARMVPASALRTNI